VVGEAKARLVSSKTASNAASRVLRHSTDIGISLRLDL